MYFGLSADFRNQGQRLQNTTNPTLIAVLATRIKLIMAA
jgi:hypothetical protein